MVKTHATFDVFNAITHREKPDGRRTDTGINQVFSFNPNGVPASAAGRMISRLRCTYVMCWILAIPLCLVGAATLAQGEPHGSKAGYPSKPVRFLIPFSAAGSNDVVARILAHQLTGLWKQQVVADNRAGANGIIGIDMAAKAPADGYTLLMTSTTFTINPSLYKLPFDPVKDFIPVALIAEGSLMLCAYPAFPARNVEQLVALAKARPGQLQFASSGLGGIAHLAGILLERKAGISLLHVPYKGSGAGVIDTVSGQVPLIFSSVSPVLPFVKNGRLRALGIGGVKRSSLLPDVPTIAEAGVPGYESNMWWGIMVPGQTPKPIIQKLNRDIRRGLDSLDVQQRFANLGMEVRHSTAKEFENTIASDINKWAGIIKAAKLSISAP